MVTIKLNLFETLVGTIFLFNTGLFLTTILFIGSLIVKQETSVYIGILISYIANLSLLFLTIPFVFLINRKSKKEFILKQNVFQFNNYMYRLNEVNYCEYYVCKWYSLPIAYFYKQQVAGLFIIKMESGEKVSFRILYRDYLKLKNAFGSIILK